MRHGIATVSLSGLLTEKLDAIAAAGFDGVEIFDNDLIASPSSPADIARRCADLGLTIDLFQPVRDLEGLPAAAFTEAEQRFRRKLDVMARLGATDVLVCSNVRPDAIDDADLRAAQLHRLGEVAAEHGVTISYEALAWGRHVFRLAHAWDAVRRADHPAVKLAVDTFHMLARGDGGEALAGVPGERIGFVQVADAPLMDMNVLEWSRHHRCFPGEGTLDVTGVVAAAVDAGYRGPLSLEVFSDVVREADPAETAREAMRSLHYLEDQVAGRLQVADRSLVPVAPPAPKRVDAGFVELAAPRWSAYPALLEALGFARAGRHRSKPVTWWRNGGANIVVNERGAVEPCPSAIGLVAEPVEGVAARAAALLWPPVAPTRAADEAPLPGITTPSGLEVLLSDTAGSRGDWKGDFVPVPGAPAGTWLGLDHLNVAIDAGHLNEEISFFRTVFDLAPGAVEEFMDPRGRLRSRALRPAEGDLRVVVNVVDARSTARSGITQLAFACDDLRSEVRRLRAAGVPLLDVPPNYYDDLVARFGLDEQTVAELRASGILYDRIGDGELLHAYLADVPGGFSIELLERRGGYDGYGSANTHVRLAAQALAAAR